MKPILILGGYGGTGRCLVRLLLEQTSLPIIIAGRRLEKARELSELLSPQFPGRVSACFADASDQNSLLQALTGVRMVVVASTTTNYTGQVAEAAITAGADYFDYHDDQKILPILNNLATAIEKAGCCFITQGGFHPGLPSAFIRYAAPSFDRFRTASLAMAMNERIEKSESVYEIIDGITDNVSEVFKGGRWEKAGYKEMKKIDFGPRFGIRSCYPIQLEEMRSLPEMFGLKEAGVYVAGFNPVVDYIILPLTLLCAKIRKGFGRRFLASLFVWGLNTFSGPRQGVTFILEAEGEKRGRPIHVRIKAEHDDAYEFTVIPIIACLLQYLDGTIARPGLRMMGHAVDPTRLMADMERMGVRITYSPEKSGENSCVSSA